MSVVSVLDNFIDGLVNRNPISAVVNKIADKKAEKAEAKLQDEVTEGLAGSDNKTNEDTFTRTTSTTTRRGAGRRTAQKVEKEIAQNEKETSDVKAEQKENKTETAKNDADAKQNAAETKEVKSEIAENNSELKAAETEVQTSTTELASAKTGLAQAQQQEQAAQAALQSAMLGGAADGLDADSQRQFQLQARKAADNAAQQTKEAEKAVETAQENLEEAKEEKAELEEEKVVLEEKEDKLESEKQDIDEEKAELTSEKEELDTDKTELEEEKAELEEEKAEIEAEEEAKKEEKTEEKAETKAPETAETTEETTETAEEETENPELSEEDKNKLAGLAELATDMADKVGEAAEAEKCSYSTNFSNNNKPAAEETKAEETKADEAEEELEIEDNDSAKAGNKKQPTEEKKENEVKPETPVVPVSDEVYPEEQPYFPHPEDRGPQSEYCAEVRLAENLQMDTEMVVIAYGEDVTVSEDEIADKDAMTAISSLEETVKAQYFSKSVYRNNISKYTDTKTVKENQEAVSDFMSAYNEAADKVNAPNVEFLSLTDKSNFETAQSLIERINQGEYIITKEIEKATTNVESIQVSAKETETKEERKCETQGENILSQLREKVVKEDDENVVEDKTDDILTKNEYQDIANFFEKSESKAEAYEKLVKDAKQYGIYETTIAA